MHKHASATQESLRANVRHDRKCGRLVILLRRPVFYVVNASLDTTPFSSTTVIKWSAASFFKD